MSQERIEEIRKNFDEISDEKEKIGIPLNKNCEHHILDKKLTIFIANFVLDSYGEGAIFGRQSHDERDYTLTNKYTRPMIKVV